MCPDLARHEKYRLSHDLMGPKWNKKEDLLNINQLSLLFCRDEATRTPDPYVPNVVRYQLRYIPIARKRVQRYGENLNYVQLFTEKFAGMRKNAYLCNLRSDGALAQLVEHRTENPCVPGSIPGGTTPPFIMNPVND